MAMRNKALSVVAAAALVGASACANIERGTGVSQEAQTGAAVGAAAGGLIAAIAGADTGWVIAAAVLGAVAGGVIAEQLTKEDKAMAGETTVDALENRPAGEPARWSNPDSGNSGEVVVDETYQEADGTYCRRFTQTINADGKTESGGGTACRTPEGIWKIQS